MGTNSSPNNASQPSPEIPSTTFIQLDSNSSVPPEFLSPSVFTVVRLRSPVGLRDRIKKSSATPALLVSVPLRTLPGSSYQLWIDNKLIPPRAVDPFRSNVIDFASAPSCWAGSAFDCIHYSMPREGLDDIAHDLGFPIRSDYRLGILEDDLVQITRSMIPFIGRKDALSLLALDQFGLILGAHLVQRYGVAPRTARARKGGLAPWQKRRASELLHENLHGGIRLSALARECGLSVSHFARSFKSSFGTSTHQWLLQHRIELAKELMIATRKSLMEIAIQSGFSDQAAFTRAFQHAVGVTPGRWRRQSNATHPQRSAREY